MRPRILFVEDDLTLLKHLTEVLSDHYAVDAAANGAEALKTVMRARPELIVTDIVMPDMDGVELLKTLRSVPSTQTIPVLLISGHAPETQRIDGFKEGADGYLAKPYTEAELRAVIGSMLKSGRQRSEIARREAREQAEQQALAERATLLESITDAFYALDGEWRFMYVNQRALDYYGKGREELIGQRLWDVFPMAKGTVFEEHFARTLREQAPGRFEAPSPITGGWIEVHTYPAGVGIAVHFQDVSARKQAESDRNTLLDRLRGQEWLLRLATHIAGLGVFTWDLKTGRVTFETEHAQALLGLGHDRPPTGRDILAHRVHPEDRSVFLRLLFASLRSGLPLHTTCRVRGSGGAWRWIEVDGGFDSPADGDAARLVGVFADTTERREMEDSLREAARRKDEFLALLAHELRNPLAPIQNGLEVLKLRKTVDPLFGQMMGIMGRQLKHLVRLVDDLVDISRLTRGRLQLRLERVLLDEVLERAIETSRPLIEAQRHELRVEYGARALMAEGDPDRLVQIFANLLSNSAKYTPPGGRISLTLDREGDEGLIRVRDNGIGIPSGALERIFEMFQQIPPSEGPRPEGLGIGLALARTLIELHRGTIHAESAGLGTGSTFTVRLPLAATSEHVEVAPAQTSLARVPLTTAHRVLVVDDNTDAAESLCRLLEMRGCLARTAADGVEAIECALAFRPELIFMDLGMPRMDGFEATRKIRARPEFKGIKIIALTGWGQAADRVRSRDAGMDEHLVKPVAAEALERVLQSLVREA